MSSTSVTSTASAVPTNLSSALGGGKAQQSNTQSANAFFSALIISIVVFGVEVIAFLLIKGFLPRI